jgi:5-methylcytosine-specific restriction enzyme B
MARDARIEAESVYLAARRFAEAALAADDSMFTPGRRIWSAGTLERLYQHFNLQPDTSKESFEAKFRRQLTGAPADVVQLAAEVVFVHLLVAPDGSILKVGRRRWFRVVAGG